MQSYNSAHYLHLDIPRVLLSSTQLWTDRTESQPAGARSDPSDAAGATLLWVCLL